MTVLTLSLADIQLTGVKVDWDAIRFKIRSRVMLEDGWVEYDAARRRAAAGDRAVPSPVYVTFPGGAESDQPAMRMVIAVQDGVPVCTHLEFSQREDGRGVRVKDLRLVQVDVLIEQILALTTRRIEQLGDGVVRVNLGQPDAEGLRDARRSVREMQRSGGRRSVTDSLLSKVAEVYRQHAGARPVEAVAAAFGKSERTAFRWVQRAREQGHLDGQR